MGYEHRKGKLPDSAGYKGHEDHVARVGGNKGDSKYGHASASDSTKKKKPKENLSDSLRKYEDEIYDRAHAGDTTGTRKANKKYAGFSERYTQAAIDNQEKQARANQDSAKKYGAYEAGIKGKLNVGGGHIYGAETTDTTASMKHARKQNKQNKLDEIRAKAKP